MAAAVPVEWDRNGLDVLDMLAELTRPHPHREHYIAEIGPTRYGRHHRTQVPPLLTQLEAGIASGRGDDRSGAGFESRPAARLEALDTLVRIDHQAARWVRDLGEDDPGNTAACVRLLGGLLASARYCGRHPRSGCCTRHEIERDIRSWWTQARIVTGWDQPAWRPDVTCPNCEKRGGLRIRLEERVGMCVECWEAWGPDAYQQLGNHVRTESEERRGRRRTGPCWCPYPVVRVPGAAPLYAMCPRCGSVRCRHAVRLVKHQLLVDGAAS